MPIPGGFGVGLRSGGGAPTIQGELSRELAGGRPLSYIGMSGQIESTGGLGRTGGGVSAPTGGGVGGGAGGATAVTGGSDIMDLYAKALERLSTGGLSLEASLADIEAGKREAIGRGQQALVSGGLGGTTVMGGVPLAAEKGAGIQRLRARGEAESKYLTTLASFAAFAQRAQEAGAERSAAMERLKLQLGTQERLAGQYGGGGRAPYIPMSERTQEAYTYGASRTPTTPSTMVSGLGPTTQPYAQQFPSIYGQDEEPTPQWV